MRKLALLLAFALLPAQAWALNTSNLLSTIAMPLAVAAVSNVTGVSQTQLANLVASLNQANVPPQQFVEVIRYVPVALVDQNGQPFVAYVQEQTTQGVTGNALVNAIVDRLRTNYNVTPVLDLKGEPTTVVLRDNYIPPVVNAQFAGDPLSLVALPLAVSAVSDITGVPQDQLATLVATLNSANVPPVQEIQIIRYAPVALVDQNGQPFIAYVQQQTTQGITGTALVPVVVQRLQTYYPAPTQIVINQPTRVVTPAPQRVVAAAEFTPPPVVVTRVEEVRRGNPHGGPPGQLKKELGLKTGAEVVHATTPVAVAPRVVQRPVEVEHEHERGRGHEKRGEGGAPPAPMISSAPAAPPQRVPVVVAPQNVPPGQAKGHGEGGDKGGDKGNGKGKGHGKD